MSFLVKISIYRAVDRIMATTFEALRWKACYRQWNCKPKYVLNQVPLNASGQEAAAVKGNSNEQNES